MRLFGLDNKKNSRSNFSSSKNKKKKNKIKKYSEKIYYIFENGTF